MPVSQTKFHHRPSILDEANFTWIYHGIPGSSFDERLTNPVLQGLLGQLKLLLNVLLCSSQSSLYLFLALAGAHDG